MLRPIIGARHPLPFVVSPLCDKEYRKWLENDRRASPTGSA